MNKILLPVFLVFIIFPAFAQNVTIGPGGTYQTLAAAGPNLVPGDSVMVLDGVYSNGTQFLNNVDGTLEDPINIYSQSYHGAVFSGGTEAIHLVDCSHIILEGFIVEGQTGNGINIDDGGDYSTPTMHIELRHVLFRNMNTSGNNDFLKLSGLDSFYIHHCEFVNGSGGGSGIDMVGCHWGVIEDNILDDAGISGIQAKGGTQHITIRRNTLKDMDQRAMNLGGSTGLQFFRPPLPSPIVNAFEAADLEVYSNIFIRSWAPIAYVGCINVKVYNNTFFKPQNWVIRILQETTTPGFLPCSNNEFRSNIIYLEDDLTEVNIGPNTLAGSFMFSNNLWFNQQSNNWSPVLPVVDINQVIGNPLFIDTLNANFKIDPLSPAVGLGNTNCVPDLDFDQFYYVNPPASGAFEGDPSIGLPALDVSNSQLCLLVNPSSNTFKVEGDLSFTNVFVIDVNGQIVDNYSNDPSPVIIDLDGLPLGIYLIKVENTNNSNLMIEKIIKM